MAQLVNTTQQKVITTFIVMVVIAALVVGIHSTNNDNSGDSAQSHASTSTTNATSTPTTSSSTYQDGVYQADGDYSSPGGRESIGVSITVAGNKVSDTTVTGKANSGVAQIYQSYFIKGYKSSVVGKNLNDIKLSRVAGSSLTSKGFNDALTKIKKQAEG